MHFLQTTQACLKVTRTLLQVVLFLFHHAFPVHVSPLPIHHLQTLLSRSDLLSQPEPPSSSFLGPFRLHRGTPKIICLPYPASFSFFLTSQSPKVS